MRRIWTPSTANNPFATPKAGVPAGVLVYEINGPFFFAAAEKFKETIIELRRAPKVCVIRDAERACHRLPEDDLVGHIDDALNAALAHLRLAHVARAAFAIPTVAREDRRRQPRPPG